MTGLELTFVVIVSSIVLTLWIAIIFYIPWCIRSGLRYRLWRLRDKIYDDVRTGRIAEINLVVSYIDDVERFIRYSQHYTLVNALITPNPSAEECRQKMRFVTTGKKALSETHLELFESYEHEATDIFFSSLFFGTVLGWLLFTVLSLLHLAIGVFKVGLANPLVYVKQQTTAAVQKFVNQLSHIDEIIEEIRDNDCDSQGQPINNPFSILFRRLVHTR